MLALARRRAVREQVKALGLLLDLGGDLVEHLLDLALILRELRAFAADVVEAGLLDLGADADREELVVLVLVLAELVLHLVARHAVRAIGAVGEHDERAELERALVLLQLGVQRLDPLDDAAVQVGRRVLGLVLAEPFEAALHGALRLGEGHDGVDLLLAVERVDADLLRLADALRERLRGVDEGVCLAALGDAAAHVDEQHRVHDGGDLRVLDELLALELGDGIAVLRDDEVVGDEAADRLLPVGDGEEHPDVVRLLLLAVDELDVQPSEHPAAAARELERREQHCEGEEDEPGSGTGDERCVHAPRLVSNPPRAAHQILHYTPIFAEVREKNTTARKHLRRGPKRRPELPGRRHAGAIAGRVRRRGAGRARFGRRPAAPPREDDLACGERRR